MIKKIALCAVLILILVPAFAMAAGPQGQGSDTARGNCTQCQQQLASQVQTSIQLQNDGDNQMLRNCNGDQECEMSRIMDRNQSQVRKSTATGQGAVSAAPGQQQDQSRDGTGNQTWTRMMDRIHLQDGSCGNCSV
jgi:hypothetical protein